MLISMNNVGRLHSSADRKIATIRRSIMTFWKKGIRRLSEYNLTMTTCKVAALLTTILFLLYVTLSSGESPKKISHKLKTLRSEGLRKISEGSDMELFKREILKPFLRERVSDTEGNRIVQQHIIKAMTRLGWTIELDSFVASTPLGEKNFTNIIAVHNPLAKRRVTVACHHDSKYFNNIKFIGAVDSAVPCAMMIDMARHLDTSLTALILEKKTDMTLSMIFFDGEEAFIDWTATDSLYGSRHLANKMADKTVDVGNGETISELQAIELFILLDLIGTEETTFKNWFMATEKMYERLQKIEMKLAKEGLLDPADSFRTRRSNKYFKGGLYNGGNGGVEDDHIPFLRKNVPVLHLISVPFPFVWHRADDNESALDYPTIDNIGKILRVFIAEYLHLTV